MAMTSWTTIPPGSAFTDTQALHQWFEGLDELLSELSAIWKPQPFKHRRPAWCDEHPQLEEELLALDDAGYQQLFADEGSLQAFLSGHIEAFAGLQALTHVPEAAIQTGKAEAHLDWEIPGRKWQQIDRFVRAMGKVNGPLLEWCGGKGHLGRVLALRKQVPVRTLEVDAELCTQGEQLARRAGVEQVFHRVDVLSPHSPPLSGLHPVALHACGELHRKLLRRVIDEGLEAVDLAPCCYHLGCGEHYRPFSEGARLTLRRDDLRLAVTGHATASRRELEQRDQEMAWKLGFIELRYRLQGNDEYQDLRPVDRRWLKLGFEGFCRALAGRESLALPAGIDWQGFEAQGWRRQHEVMRLSLPRHAVRHALELWLVLDMALELQQAGYEIRLQRFCPAYISPRNLLLSARRRAVPFD